MLYRNIIYNLLQICFWVSAVFTPTCSLFASTLHCILAVNTVDQLFGEGSHCNLGLMWEMCQTAAVCTEMDLNVQLITDDNLTPENLRNALHGLSVNSDDAILFYFNSHGKMTPDCQDPLPALSFPAQPQFVSLDSVVRLLLTKEARLTLVFAEVCNHKCGSERQLYSLAQTSVLPFVDGYRKLFSESAGLLVAAAARKGQTAWLDRKNGSIFTRNLVAAIEREVQCPYCSWEQVLNITCKQTVRLSESYRTAQRQEPYYHWQPR